VFHHAGIKIPFFAFFAHDSGIRTKEPPVNMLIAMFIAAGVSIFNGSYPWVLYSLLPWSVDYAPYTWSHVITQTQLLFFSALAFIFLKLTNLYPPELPSTNIDAEWAYRRLLPRMTNGVIAMFAPVDRAMRGLTLARFERFVQRLYRHYGPDGVMARTWPTGSTALWVAILLSVYLLLSYV
ncbi:MAG: Na(+)/H(+) antiporter subunit D, partial [Paracoccaceae bacterium]|nr:Na(+)/H(+) antiporter subunit D [Paracoccaceae bacterium]